MITLFLLSCILYVSPVLIPAIIVGVIVSSKDLKAQEKKWEAMIKEEEEKFNAAKQEIYNKIEEEKRLFNKVVELEHLGRLTEIDIQLMNNKDLEQYKKKMLGYEKQRYTIGKRIDKLYKDLEKLEERY